MHRMKKMVRYFSVSTPRTISLLLGVLVLSLFSMTTQLSPYGLRSQNIASAPSRGVTDTEMQFLSILNAARAAKGAGPLTISNTLTQSAQFMSQDMVSRGTNLSHVDSQGRDPSRRIPAFGYPSPPNGASENIGYSTLSDAQTIYDGFYNQCDPGSSGACTYAHRTNMLDPEWAAVGIAETTSGGASYWAVDFGSKLDAPLASGGTGTNPTPTPTPTPASGTAGNPTPTPTPVPVALPTPNPGNSNNSTPGISTSQPNSPPSTAPTLISCSADIPASVTFEMNKPIYAKTDGIIQNITYKSGNWCAWSPTDTINFARCPLACPDPSGTGYPFTTSQDKLSFYSNFDAPYSDNSGSCTYTVSCSSSGVSPSVTPTGVANIQNAAIALNTTLPGISPNTGIGDNSSPVHSTRNFTVALYDNNDTLTKSVAAQLTFNGTSYTGIATFSDIPPGPYIVKVRSDNSLYKTIPGPRNLISDTTIDTPQVALVTGNVDNTSGSENILDLSDYNALLSCFDNKACDSNLKALTDLNDDGKVDSKDFNILLRGFATRTGE